MAREPINKILQNKRSVLPRQRIWQLIREFKTFTYQRMHDATGLKEDNIREYANSLFKAGVLNKSKNSEGYTEYALLKDFGIEAPRVNRKGEFVTQGSKNQQMWNTMCNFPNFSINELVGMASIEESVINEETAKTYVRVLCKAGYLTRREDRYNLKLNMIKGPRAPMIQRLKTVFDPNINEIVYQEGLKDD